MEFVCKDLAARIFGTALFETKAIYPSDGRGVLEQTVVPLQWNSMQPLKRMLKRTTLEHESMSIIQCYFKNPFIKFRVSFNIDR